MLKTFSAIYMEFYTRHKKIGGSYYLSSAKQWPEFLEQKEASSEGAKYEQKPAAPLSDNAFMTLWCCYIAARFFYRTCFYRTCSTLTFLAVLGILGPWTSFSFDCRIFSFFFSRIRLANCLISIISSSSLSGSLSYSPAASLSSSSFSSSSSFLDFEEAKWRSDPWIMILDTTFVHGPGLWQHTGPSKKELNYLIITLSHT